MESAGKVIMIFRPHHFLCAFCFTGKGYSPAFVQNFQAIRDVLEGPSGDEASISIVREADSICAPCPHRRQTSCHVETKIAALDQAHTEALELQQEKTLTWGTAKKRIIEKISREKFARMCALCEWKSLGICAQKLFGSSAQ
jgi:hypothetical protein